MVARLSYFVQIHYFVHTDIVHQAIVAMDVVFCLLSSSCCNLQAMQKSTNPPSQQQQSGQLQQHAGIRAAQGTPLFKTLLADLQLAVGFVPQQGTAPLLRLNDTGMYASQMYGSA